MPHVGVIVEADADELEPLSVRNDLYSALSATELRQTISLDVTLRAQESMSFSFTTIQSDNGPEFQRYFHDMLAVKGIALRHSRVRQSNDDAHIERFNRTIQEECLWQIPNQGRNNRSED